LCLKGRRGDTAREVSRGHSSREAKGRRNGRAEGTWILEWDRLRCSRERGSRRGLRGEAASSCRSEKPTLATLPLEAQALRRENSRVVTSTVPTARCGPACRVVWEGRDGGYHRPLSRFDKNPAKAQNPASAHPGGAGKPTSSVRHEHYHRPSMIPPGPRRARRTPGVLFYCPVSPCRSGVSRDSSLRRNTYRGLRRSYKQLRITP
jgi:hypothetical protein